MEAKPRKCWPDAGPRRGVRKPFRSPLKASLHSNAQSPAYTTFKSSSAGKWINTAFHLDPVSPCQTSYPLHPSVLAHSTLAIPLPLRILPPRASDDSPQGPSVERSLSPRNLPMATPNAVAHVTLQLSNIKKNINILSQSIESLRFPQHAELEASILKWRSIAQAVADELFDTMKKRIENTGGGDATEFEKEQYPRREQEWRGGDREIDTRRLHAALQSSEDEDESSDDDSHDILKPGVETSGLSERERKTLRKVARRELRAAMVRWKNDICEDRTDSVNERWRYKAQDKDEIQEAAVPTHKPYTMETMLRSLNVDLNAIGFGGEEQGWIE